MSEPEFRPDVVAGKYDPKLFDPTGAELLVNEVFYSLQGEGHHTGQATIFIRLAKCNLACKFCDTEFETFHRRSYTDVVYNVRNLAPGLPLVDLTGGEPLLQNCDLLVRKLQDEGYHVGVETSGSVWAEWAEKLNWITLSPKVPRARIPQPLLERCNEVKWIVNDAWLAMFNRNPQECRIPEVPNYLQPESNIPKYITAASKLVMAHPHLYRLSLQTHKLAGNP